MKGLVLLSGGLDSTLALIKLLDQGHSVKPVFVDYRQWSRLAEMESVEEVWDWCHVTFGDRLLPMVRQDVQICSNDEGLGSVWGRGITLVGLAAMYAYTHDNDYDFVALGNHKGDVGPDCKPGLFDRALAEALSVSTRGKLSLLLPVRGLTTDNIGVELQNYGIPFETMYSCYWCPPCGYKSKSEEYRCPGCRRKTLAMRAAGVADTEILAYPNGSGDRSYQSPLAEEVGY